MQQDMITLRIAKAMLDDWQNDTCEGKYLKNIFENRIDKDTKRIQALGGTRSMALCKRVCWTISNSLYWYQ
jgi:hypothetical protein